MLKCSRPKVSVAATLAVLFAFMLFASADDPSTDIVIVCPDSVSAGQTIYGHATEYTPACHLVAFGKGGVVIHGQTSNPFLTPKVYFAYPTQESDVNTIILITATDSEGQRGSKPVMVTP